MDISRAVGTIRNRIACSINVMPLLAYEGKGDGEDERTILCSAIDGTGETTGLSGEMELEVEVEQVLKSLARDLAYGTLTDVGEHCIQQFTEYGCPDARSAVWEECEMGYVRRAGTHSRG